MPRNVLGITLSRPPMHRGVLLASSFFLLAIPQLAACAHHAPASGYAPRPGAPGSLAEGAEGAERAAEDSQRALTTDGDAGSPSPEDAAKKRDDASAPPEPPELASSDTVLTGVIERPSHVACVLLPEASLQGYHDDIFLRVSAGSPVFGKVLPRDHGPLVVGVGSPATATYELSTRGMFVRGFVAPDTIALHPRRAVVFGGMVSAGPTVGLSWASASEGIIPVHWDLPDGFTLRGRHGVEQALSCADLGTERASYANGKPASSGTVLLAAGHSLDLALLPGAPPVAHVVPTSESRLVDRLEEQGGNIRIGLPFGDAYLTGWAPSSVIEPFHGGYGRGGVGHRGYGVRTQFSPRATGVAICKTDIPIDALVGGARARIGRVIGGACIELFTPEGPQDIDTSVDVYKAPFALESNAKLLVPSASLSSCTIVPKAELSTHPELPATCR